MLASACSSDASSTSEKELELRERELALKEKELGLEQSSNSNDDAANNNGQYNGENTTSRSSGQRNSNPAAARQKSPEEIKRDLALKECETPTSYLKGSNSRLDGTYKNALSMKFDGFKLKFNIKNNATILTFKNVRCRVTFTSNSGSTILSKNFTVNEFIQAGNSIYYKGEFSCTNQQFKDTDSYSIDILGAECH